MAKNKSAALDSNNSTDIDRVPIGHVFVYLNNPRHEPADSEPKAIGHLCAKENVFPLARDIAKIGLNPLERFALVPVTKGASGSSARFHVVEGNRRLCAIKLLNDPDLAPANLRKQFSKLAESWSPIKNVRGTVFDDVEDARIWLDRIHNGPQGGIGRKQWNAEQKSRFDGDSKNRAAQGLLDYAQQSKMLTADERAGKLTTVQRFLSNQIFREAMGFDQSNADDLARTRPQPEFDTIVKRFIRDLVGGEKVTSRMNKEDIVKYARPLASLPGVTATRIEPESISPGAGGGARGHRKKQRRPRKLAKVNFVQHEEEIATALGQLDNKKLMSLYYSICSVDLEYHTPIVSVGAWAFFETLTGCAGRQDNVSFDAFLSADKLRQFGVTQRDNIKAIQQATGRIAAYGNTTKHHAMSANFNGDQLNNDITTLRSVILNCIASAGAVT